MFYSILFPSQTQEQRAKRCPWLVLRPRALAPGATVTRGNKSYPADRNSLTPGRQTPSFFADTGLEPVLDAVLGDTEETPLRRVYYALATDADTVRYRQAVMRELEREDVGQAVRAFCGAVESAVRTITDGETAHLAAQREKYLVDGAAAYCDAVHSLLAACERWPITSDGLRLFLEAVRAYAREPRFLRLEALLRQAKEGIEAISFTLRVSQGKVWVGADRQDGDFVHETWADFACMADDGAAAKPPREIRLFGELALGPLGILIAGVLEKEHAEAFALLHTAAEAAGAVADPMILTFTEETRFYLRYLDTLRALKARGLPYAYPVLSGADTLRITGAYDLDLALRQDTVVPNDCTLLAAERGIVITGANHSGKTTFLRALGQVAALAALGLPVPCAAAKLPLFGSFFSHFSDAEEGAAELGRLKEELCKLKPILQTAGAGSLVLLNEMFSSTTVRDAQALAALVIGDLTGGGARVLCVTHTLSEMPDGMVSMAAQVTPDTHERLYTIVRAPAETRAHADALMAQYRLRYQDVKERISHGC